MSCQICRKLNPVKILEFTFIIVLLFSLLSTVVHASTRTVTTLNDSGAGSLRQTIIDASSGDTILFGVTGTITLASELLIDKSLTINGGLASNMTISGNNSVRVFYVIGHSTVVFENLTIANGHNQNGGSECGIASCGGAIVINGVQTFVTINDSHLHHNTVSSGGYFSTSDKGGAIYVRRGGKLLINDSIISNNSADFGGAIYISEGDLIIGHSTVSDNEATHRHGGGIYYVGDPGKTMLISSSTFSGNVAADSGGGYYHQLNRGSAKISSSTFSGNRARLGGAILTFQDDLIISDTTITLNHADYTSGAIYSGGSMTITNSIVSGNTKLTGMQPDDLGGSGYISNGYNLIGIGGSGFNQTGDQTGVTDPQLAPLADNGGITPILTHFPLAGSPVIEQGGSCLADDQRGFPRPVGSACDIGAVELQGANLTIVKNTVGSDGAFTFSLTSVPDFTITTVANTGNHVISSLFAGTYSLAETVPSGWALSSAICDDGSILPDVVLSAGEQVTCTFTNTQLGQIQINKNTSPAAAGSFSFSDTIEAPNSFSLAGGATKTFTNVMPGSYTVTENDPTASNFKLSGMTCADTDSTVDIPNRTASINVDAGETVICSFTNTEDDTVTIEKITYPAGIADKFFFDTNLGSPGLFSLGSAEHISYSNVSPGTYRVQELNLPAGFDLTAINCYDTHTGQTFQGDLVNHLVDLSMTSGESVHCAFTNTQRGKIIVDKETEPGGDTQSFDFTLTGGPDNVNTSFSLTDSDTPAENELKPGHYKIDESLVSGWDLSKAKCDDGSDPSKKITLDPGEIVTCTFTNTKRGKITIDKVTDPVGDLQSFDFTLSGGPDAVSQPFALTDTATPYDSSNLKAGTYNVTESVPAGWDLSSAVCSDGSDAGSISLDPGEEVSCTFTNTLQRGTIIINKSTLPAGGTGFTFSDDITAPNNFSLDDAGTKTFTNVMPGSYSITENDPFSSGYKLSDLSCTDSSTGAASSWDIPSRTATINLDPGETVTCSYSNTELDTIVIEKVTIPAGRSELFTFSQSIDATGNFTLSDGLSKTFSNISAGNYSITEQDPGADFDLTGISCHDTASGQSFSGDLSTGTVQLNLVAGEVVHCIYENTYIVTPPAFPVVPGAVDFGSQLLGTTSSPVTSTITNTTALDQAVGTISSSVPGEFIMGQNNCSGKTLKPGDSCTFETRFSPAQTGLRSGQVDIVFDLASIPYAVSGTGVSATAKPIPTLSFWAQLILILMLALMGGYGISSRRFN